MFNSEDLKCLDPKYFNIITTAAYDVTIMSRNTGHYWHLHNPEYPEHGAGNCDHLPLASCGQIRESSGSSAWQSKYPATGGTEHSGA